MFFFLDFFRGDDFFDEFYGECAEFNDQFFRYDSSVNFREMFDDFQYFEVINLSGFSFYYGQFKFLFYCYLMSNFLDLYFMVLLILSKFLIMVYYYVILL